VDGVQAEYRDIPVIWEVSLGVGQGEIVALVGGNGAGKTTLLRVLSGLREGFLRVTRGAVRFRGEGLQGLDPAEIVARGIAHVPEGRHLFPGLSVRDNLRLGGYLLPARGARETLPRVLEMLPFLKERRRQLAGTLSGGEQQLLAIGRALVGRPRLLLLDEPTEGLMPSLVALVEETMRRLRAEGTTILLVEQNLATALSLGDRVYVMEKGEIRVTATPAELQAAPDVLQRYLGVTSTRR
jgi:branched-chain amino acid transport system ATP-binding protein